METMIQITLMEAVAWMVSGWLSIELAYWAVESR